MSSIYLSVARKETVSVRNKS